MQIAGRLMRVTSRQAIKKAFIGVLIFLVVFSVAGFVAVPPILKSVLTKKLSESLHRQVVIGKVKFNPFALSLTLKACSIRERNGSGPFLAFDEVYVNLQSISIIRGGPVLSEVKIVRPYLHVVRNDDGTYNFSDLIAGGPKKEKGKTPRFSLNNIQILDGSIDFIDGPKNVTHRVRDMNIGIPFISSLPYYVDTYVQPLFEARVNDTPVLFKGRTKPFESSLETVFEINIKDLDIPHYLAYFPFKRSLRMPTGFFEVHLGVSYVQYKDKPPSLTLNGNIALRNISVVDLHGAPLVDLPYLKISFAPSDIIARKLHLTEVLFMSPALHIARDKAAGINLLSLLPEKTPEPPAKKEGSPFSLIVDRVRAEDGRLEFRDSLPKTPFDTRLERIEATIENLSNAKDRKAKAVLSFQSESGEGVKGDAYFSINPLVSEGAVEIKRLPLRKYAPYYSSGVLFDVEDGLLDISTRYRFVSSEGEPQFNVSELSAELSSLKLRKHGEKSDFLDVPLIECDGVSADGAKKELIVGRLSSQDGLIRAKRLSDGRVSLQDLVRKAPAMGKKPVHAEKKRDWVISVKDLAFERYAVKVEDAVPQEPVHLEAERITLKASGLSTARNAKGKASISFAVGKKGSISVGGSLGMDPLSANMKLNVRSLDIKSFQPYFTDRVKIIVTQGAASLKGTISAARAKDGSITAAYRGDASITNFASVDKVNADPFLKWDSLFFGKVDARSRPLQVKISQVALTDFYSRFIINKNGTINLQGILLGKEGEAESTPAAETAAQPAAEVSAMPAVEEKPDERPLKESETTRQAAAIPQQKKPERLVKIDAVTLQGGTIDFSDRHIEPSYSTSFHEIGGRISGLSSEENKFADVELRGKLEDYAPLEITGKINPLRDDLYVDLKIDFKGMDMSPVTPYSGRYLGYTIQKGTLSLSLEYLIVKKKLDSQNQVFLDQFTLGDKVESPKATKLPVKLAIALLKNRKGEINLNVPVSGYINDPKFSLGRIIIKMFLNLLTKVATSPFKLLGALFGHGEELSYVVFDYGSADIGAQEGKKLETLVKALSDRPALKLEIEGHADMINDREGLKQYLFRKKIKAQKLKEMVKKGQAAVPVDDIVVGPDEYARYLKMAYKQEKFPKPRNILGMAKSLPVPEMEKLMLANIKVTDDDLRQLASRRALKVKEQILKSGQVSPERVFLVEPKSIEPEKQEKVRSSRVDFRLK
jgi:hypothetical protein